MRSTQGVTRELPVFELVGPLVTRPLEGARKKNFTHGPRACAWTRGTGGGEPPAVGDGPVFSSDEGVALRTAPNYGSACAGLSWLRGKAEDRGFTTARKIQTADRARSCTRALQAATNVTDRKESS